MCPGALSFVKSIDYPRERMKRARWAASFVVTFAASPELGCRSRTAADEGAGDGLAQPAGRPLRDDAAVPVS
jgi:hypothetical protein